MQRFSLDALSRPGDLIVVPDASHSLQAVEDSAVLLIVAELP